VARIISALDKTLRWALYDREPLDFWGVGRVTLLGDAAHAMLPHQGQGAGQSIEDAAFLTRCLQQATQETLPQWLRFYEEQRKTRTTQVQQTTRVAGTLYDLPDSEVNRRGENFSFAERMKWLFNYDVDQAFDEALQLQTGRNEL
jgi:salicylate hydroxylase